MIKQFAVPVPFMRKSQVLVSHAAIPLRTKWLEVAGVLCENNKSVAKGRFAFYAVAGLLHHL